MEIISFKGKIENNNLSSKKVDFLLDQTPKIKNIKNGGGRKQLKEKSTFRCRRSPTVHGIVWYEP